MDVKPSLAAAHPKAADADILGEAVRLKPPAAGEVPAAEPPAGGAQPAPLLPEPPPAEDENQPGFIGQRNRPAP